MYFVHNQFQNIGAYFFCLNLVDSILQLIKIICTIFLIIYNWFGIEFICVYRTFSWTVLTSNYSIRIKKINVNNFFYFYNDTHRFIYGARDVDK